MSLQWHYLDSQGTEFGPFDGEKMRNWFEQGYFHVAGENLLVRLAEWRTHRRLGEAYNGDRAAYFVAPPRQQLDGAPPPSEAHGNGRPPQGNGWHGADHGAGSPYGVPTTALARYEPPGGGASPYGGAASPWHHPPPQHSWGGRCPPPGPWGPHPGHPGGPHPQSPYGWGGAPGPYGGAYGGGWGPYGAPPPAMGYGHQPPYGFRPPMLHDDRGRSRSRSRSRGPRQQRNTAAENAARAAQEQEAELRRLGRDGLRDLLTSTLESLYKDRIKPMSNYVKGRLKERSCPEALIKSFVEFYGQHPDLFRLQASPSDETAIFFVTDPSWFKGWVDIDAPDDPYDEVMWQAFKEFLDSGHAFAGGRYGMARELAQRNLSFLSPFSLGEICHIVQLAIQKRKIIVYHRKMLKPMPAAGIGGDAIAASAGENGAGADAEDITEFSQLYRVIFKTLRRHPSGIRLSRLKQMIKEECQCRLNEMAFKCTKLIELFRQEPLRAVFVLEDDGKEFVIRSGDPKLFSEEVRRIHAEVSADRSAA